MLGRDDAQYQIDSIKIDPGARTIERDGQNVPVPFRAFDMLLLLVQRRGEVVPKEELLSRIWGDTHVEESNLPVMISAIRRAIGDDGRQQKLIQTVSKSGYRFIGQVSQVAVLAKPVDPTPVDAKPDDAEESAIFEAAEPAAPIYNPVPAKPLYPRFSFTPAFTIAAITALLVVSVGSIVASRRIAAASRPVYDARSLQVPRARAEMWSQKGRYAWNLQTKAGILQSIEYYQNAIADDDRFAPGYAGLAASYVALPSYSEGPGDEGFSRARATATKAVALDDHLADAHIGLGMVYLIVDRNFALGAQEFRKATSLDPHSSLAEGELALCLIAVGETDDAVAHARQAKALDPLSIRAATDLGIVLYYGHRFTESETELEEVLKLDPYAYRPHVNLGKTYLQLGKFEDARRVLEEASTLSNHDPLAEGLRAEAEGLAGNTQAAEAILASLHKRAQTAYVAPVSFAFALTGLGRPDDALFYLQKTRANRAIAALYFKVDPTWNGLHGSPGFSDLIKDIPFTAVTNPPRAGLAGF